MSDLSLTSARVKSPGVYHAGHADFGTSSDSDATRIQAAIDAAAAAGVPRVLVPEEMLPYSGVTFNTAVQMIREGQVSDVYDVKAYGAKADGSTDDATAIQSAIDTASNTAGSRVWFPPGDYSLSSPLILPKHTSGRVVLEGRSPADTRLTRSNNQTSGLSSRSARSGSVTDDMDVDAVVIVDHPNNDFQDRLELRNLRLSGTGQGGTSYGLYAPRISRALLENVEVTNVSSGFTSFQLFLTHLSSCRFAFVTDGFEVADDGSGLGGSTSLVMSNCYVNHAENSGYIFFGLDYSTLQGCAADDINSSGGTGEAAYRVDACRGLSLISCGCEISNAHVVWGDGLSTWLTIIGMRATNIDGVSSGTTSYLRWEQGRFNLENCVFGDFSNASNSFNEIIQSGADVVYRNVDRPGGGNSFISFNGGSTLIVEKDGSLSFHPADACTVRLPRYSNSARPSAGTAGHIIFNTDDDQLNIDDGTNWTLPDGTTT